MNNKVIYKKRLAVAVMATMVSGWGAFANANDYSLTGNKFVIENRTTTIANTTLASTGVLSHSGSSLPNINVDDATLKDGLPSFAFELAAGDQLLANTSHTFKIGLSITDNADPDNRRFEAYIGELTLNVDANKNVTGTIPSQDMKVEAKKGSLEFVAAINNPSVNGPFSISGDRTLVFKGTDAVNRLEARNNSVINALLDDFTLNGTFTFRVVVQQVSSTGTGVQAARVGVTSGSTYTAVPRITTSCAADNNYSTVGNVFKLITDTGFTNAYAVQGQFTSGTAGTTDTLQAFTNNCAVSGGGTTGGGTTGSGNATTDTAVGGLTTAATAVSNADSPTAAAAAINNVVTNLTDIANQVQDGSATLTAAQVTNIQASATATMNASVNSLVNALSGNTTEDLAAFQSAVASLRELSRNLTRARIPASDEFIAAVSNAGAAVATQAARRAAPAGSSDAAIRAQLSANNRQLDAVLDSALPLPPFALPDTAATQARIQSSAGANVNAALATKLANVFTSVILAPNSFRSNGQTIGVILEAAFTSGQTGVQAITFSNERTGTVLAATHVGIVQDETTGIVKITLPGESYSGMISAIKAVSDIVPTGVRIRSDGSAVIVTNNLAIELSPVALDPVALAAAIEASGYDFDLRSSGALSLDLGMNNRFAGVVAYDNLTGEDLSSCGTLTIVEPTLAVTDPMHSFGINCSNGVEQRIVPYVDNVNFITSLNDADIPYAIDRNSGIITSEGNGRFKPSFFVSPLTAADTAFHEANKDANGVAFQALDVNGDGRIDFKVIAPNGTQILYGVD